MKTLIVGLTTALSLITQLPVEAREKVIVYLVDPQDPSTAPLDPIDIETPPDVPTTPVAKKKTGQERLDDLIKDIQKEDGATSEKRKRVSQMVLNEQKEFVQLLDTFARETFNRNDDNAEPEFIKVRARVAELVFNAPTTRDFYERLYLINESWLSHQNEVERYESLDRELHDLSIKMEARQKTIRNIITGVSTVVGLTLGGYLSVKASQRIVPVVANEGGLSSIAKFAGRATIVLVGAGVGAAAGAYAGFLGSDLLFQHQREFLDPINGSEDLREILDYLDGISAKPI